MANQSTPDVDERSVPSRIDAGLRQYMLGIYNYMAGGLALTGIVAYTGFTAAGDPAKFNQTGVSIFCAGDDGVLRKNPNVGGGVQGAGVGFDPWTANCVNNPWTVIQ